MTREELMRIWNEIALLIEGGKLTEDTAASLRRSAHREDLIEGILAGYQEGLHLAERLQLTPEEALIESCEYTCSQHCYP